MSGTPAGHASNSATTALRVRPAGDLAGCALAIGLVSVQLGDERYSVGHGSPAATLPQLQADR
jgi:hypothetical protein